MKYSSLAPIREIFQLASRRREWSAQLETWVLPAQLSILVLVVSFTAGLLVILQRPHPAPQEGSKTDMDNNTDMPARPTDAGDHLRTKHPTVHAWQASIYRCHHGYETVRVIELTRRKLLQQASRTLLKDAFY